jgi:UDP-N-acetylglucosamine--N-acetylmuramyl-(pentapeptide) pyrophosphoryl-undecaprenol N-acetylglucosamine transferase
MNSEGGPEIRIMLVGGGTGGHFYPLVALAEAMCAVAPRPRLYYAGPNPYDETTLQKFNIEFVKIFSGKQRRYASLLNIIDSFKVFFGTLTALIKLFIIYPDVIVSKGGYTSAPIILAGAFLRIPILIHESDSVMGRANILGTRFAKDIVVNYPEIQVPKTRGAVHTLGIPIRKALMGKPTENMHEAFGIDPERPVILILGGSQGAERINELVLDSLDELLTRFTVIHQTGKAHFDLCTASADNLIPDTERRQYYIPKPFFSDTALNDLYALADLVISRAGSTSIYEIALHGKPSIIIPIPQEISHDQRSNAYAYARRGATSVIEESNITDNLLLAEIERIMKNREVYTEMSTAALNFGKTDTAERMTALILERAKQH